MVIVGAPSEGMWLSATTPAVVALLPILFTSLTVSLVVGSGATASPALKTTIAEETGSCDLSSCDVRRAEALEGPKVATSGAKEGISLGFADASCLWRTWR